MAKLSLAGLPKEYYALCSLNIGVANVLVTISEGNGKSVSNVSSVLGEESAELQFRIPITIPYWTATTREDRLPWREQFSSISSLLGTRETPLVEHPFGLQYVHDAAVSHLPEWKA
ncbi:uncharacterized protein PgNI_09364 [Pyricularia grisea]|uniref:Uncharacterized protein n=1 Tax=Pyricularia grisea TaxID=148305 RepID=A0A6P8ARS6_PYRGI|nr:uncharacterized protein PgNI_09364 [Pyricularia grisea]TLD04818.1 hypothetical protein PgNI_09364 [Pyricularia grisea]